MKAILTINNKQVQAEINEEELRAALGESKEFRWGERYWFVNDQNNVTTWAWTDNIIDNYRFKAHNAFKTEAKAHAEKMRRESVASRLDFVPKEGVKVWYWYFGTEQVICAVFSKSYLIDWNIGCIKRTKEECEAWATKYAEYFKLPV